MWLFHKIWIPLWSQLYTRFCWLYWSLPMLWWMLWWMSLWASFIVLYWLSGRLRRWVQLSFSNWNFGNYFVEHLVKALIKFMLGQSSQCPLQMLEWMSIVWHWLRSSMRTRFWEAAQKLSLYGILPQRMPMSWVSMYIIWQSRTVCCGANKCIPTKWVTGPAKS